VSQKLAASLGSAGEDHNAPRHSLHLVDTARQSVQ
jgi:hypothetical protein